MAALTSGSWNVSFLHGSGAQGMDTSVGSKLKTVNAIMTLVTGGASPALGVPWPDKGKFGFTFKLDNILIHNPYPFSTTTVGAITVSGNHVIAMSNATAGKIRFLKLSSMSGTSARAYAQVATTLTLGSSMKLYVTALGW